MPYTTRSEIEKRIPARVVGILSNDTGEAEGVNVVITECIADADSVINSYLAGRYTTPIIAPIPQLIERISSDIAVYFLYRRKFFDDMPESLTDMYDQAIAQLKAIAKGDILLDVAVPPNEKHLSGIKINKTPCDRVFTKDLLSRMP